MLYVFIYIFFAECKMKIDELIKQIGEGKASVAAKRLGVSRQTLYNWKKGIPYKTQCKIYFDFQMGIPRKENNTLKGANLSE